MARTLRTLLLSATALGTLATAAMAATPTPPPMSADGSMASMHPTGGHDPSSHDRLSGGDRS